MKRTLISLALAASALFVAPVGPASADTEKCADRVEYDNLEYGLTVDQVANRFDIYGQLLSDSDSRFRRGYRPCWAPGDRLIVIAFSYNDGGAVNWFVRDAE